MKPNYIELTVRGFHIDVFGHVNNARYLEFLEDARWAIFDDVIKKIRTNQWSFVIVNININYRKPAQIGQQLRIDAELSRIGNKSFTISQKVYAAKNPELAFADAAVTCVILDNEGQPIVIDEKMKRELF